MELAREIDCQRLELGLLDSDDGSGIERSPSLDDAVQVDLHR